MRISVRNLTSILLTIAPLACSASVPPAPQEKPPAEAPAVSALAPSSAPAPVGPPSARVTAIEVSRESIDYRRAKIVFTNPLPRPCRFTGYKLIWGASSKTIQLDDVTIPAGETRERSLRVNFGDGDIPSLTVENCTVEVQTDCSGR